MNTAVSLEVGLPYLTLLTGTLIVMIGVSIKRTHLVAAILTIVTIVLSLLAHVPAWEAMPIGGIAIFGLAEIDGIAYFFNLLFLLGAFVTALLAYPWLNTLAHREEFYLLLLTATFGAMVMSAATHFASFILGLEILSISLYALIAYPQVVRPPVEAALKYLILSGVASTSILFGMALVYGASGSMDFTDVAVNRMDPQWSIYLMGQAFIWVGLAFKLSLIPFHMWTPDVYQGAPSIVTGYIATVSKAAVFSLILRFALETELLRSDQLFVAVALVAALSMIGGNVLALLQKNLKRLLAYSSIAHMGYLLIAILIMVSARPAIAMETLMLYLAAYFMITIAAFGVVSMVSAGAENQHRSELLDYYTGMFWRQPTLATIMTTVALSLAGIPLTVGFIAKFYLIAAGIEGGLWILVWSLIIGSAIGVYYYVRVIFTMTKPVEEGYGVIAKPFWPAAIAVLILGVAMVYLGIYPTPLIEFIDGVTAISGA